MRLLSAEINTRFQQKYSERRIKIYRLPENLPCLMFRLLTFVE